MSKAAEELFRQANKCLRESRELREKGDALWYEANNLRKKEQLAEQQAAPSC